MPLTVGVRGIPRCMVMYTHRMARMIRKQVYITPSQDAALKRRARERKVTESDLIREALDQAEAPAPASRHGGRDPEAWADLQAILKKQQARARKLRASGAPVPPQEKCDREEAYRERIERLVSR